NPYHLLSDWKRESEPEEHTRHEARRQLDLVQETGAVCEDNRLVFKTRTSDRRSLHHKLARSAVLPGEALMVAHCGATAASRRYPIEYFAEALLRVGRRAGTVILTGDVTEQCLTRRVREICGKSVPIVDLAGTLSLG